MSLENELAAEELASILEDLFVTISWYEDGNFWAVQGVSEEKIDPRLLLQYTKIEPLVTKIEDENWLQKVYKDFAPFSVGPFEIFGSHSRDDIRDCSKLPLEINAATAFGSGQHPTTKGCLLALSDLYQNKIYLNPLDLGCGSGILAIAAIRLGSPIILASDNDPEAVRITKEHSELNGVSEKIILDVGEGTDAQEIQSRKHFDLIIANILFSPLQTLANSINNILDENGVLVLSGITNAQKEPLLETYSIYGFHLASSYDIDEWSAVVLKKSKP